MRSALSAHHRALRTALDDAGRQAKDHALVKQELESEHEMRGRLQQTVRQHLDNGGVRSGQLEAHLAEAVDLVTNAQVQMEQERAGERAQMEALLQQTSLSQILEMESQLAMAKASRSKLEQQLSTAQSQVEALTAKWQAEGAESLSLNEQLIRSSTELATVCQRLQQERLERSKVQLQADRLRRELESSRRAQGLDCTLEGAEPEWQAPAMNDLNSGPGMRDLAIEISDLRKSILTEKSHRLKAEARVSEMTSETASLETKCSQESDQRDVLNKHITQLCESLQQVKQQRDALEVKLAGAVEEVTQLRMRLGLEPTEILASIASPSRVARMQQRVKFAQDTSLQSTLECQVAEAEKERANAEKQAVILQAENGALLGRMEKEKAAKQAQINRLEQELVEITNQKALVKAELEEQMAKLRTELTQEAENSKRACIALESNVGELKAELRSVREHRSDTMSQLRSASDQQPSVASTDDRQKSAQCARVAQLEKQLHEALDRSALSDKTEEELRSVVSKAAHLEEKLRGERTMTSSLRAQLHDALLEVDEMSKVVVLEQSLARQSEDRQATMAMERQQLAMEKAELELQLLNRCPR